MSDKCCAPLGETRFNCHLAAGHSGQHQAYLDTVDEVVFFGGRPESRTLCKECFGEIDPQGFSVHGGADVAARLKAAASEGR